VWQVVGQDKAVSLLQRSLEKDALAHAYLLIGPPRVGKMTLALNLAQALNCDEAGRPCGQCLPCQKIASANHPDVQIIGLAAGGNAGETRLRTEIGIDQIREVQHSASLPPFEGKYKVFIVDGGELMSTEAANCLLKTLEEPNERVVFILLTAKEHRLPQTVVSRCQRLELPPMAVAGAESALAGRWGIEPARAKLLARLSHGCLGWALSAAFSDGPLQQRGEKLQRLLEMMAADYEARFACAAQLASQFTQNREAVLEILGLWLDWWRDLMLVKVGSDDLVTNVDRSSVLGEMASKYSLGQIRDFMESILAAGEQLRQNANARLVLEVLMLDMPGKEERRQEKVTAR
jgi:DNA polymerase-3 subunit delta'